MDYTLTLKKQICIVFGQSTTAIASIIVIFSTVREVEDLLEGGVLGGKSDQRPKSL